MKDLFERLRKGETVEDIAKSFTDELNQAEKDYKEYQKQQAKKKEAEKNKVELAQGILDAIYLYITECYPDVKIKTDIDAKKFVKIIDNYIGFFDGFKTFDNFFVWIFFHSIQSNPKTTFIFPIINWC